MFKIVCSGFGGQGILTLGRVLAEIALMQEKEVTWMPSYGAEMRGGTANCSVIVADKMIGSPIASTKLDVLCAMNVPSVLKFLERVKPGGIAFINSSIVTEKAVRDDISIYEIDATNIAGRVGSIGVANMVMLAAFLKHTDLFTFEEVEEVLTNRFKSRREDLNALNVAAVKAGMECVTANA